ncbi:hypothetical protein [Flavobacterium sp.]|jgi:hypothetical protein|uniref:hypothetical protein n=1 Tax=Flavobacterium sp. TaxID=239 RepID=UPI003BC1B1D9
MFNINNKITSSQNTEENSLQTFKRAVNNGQTRLALEALVDVIDVIIDVITDDSPEDIPEEVITKLEALVDTTTEVVEIKEVKQDTPLVEAQLLSSSSKKKVKEATTETA